MSKIPPEPEALKRARMDGIKDNDNAGKLSNCE